MSTINPFLKTLAEALFRDYGDKISEVCMVFPNRRTGLFFKNYLAVAAGKTIWSPQIYTVSEFMQQLSELQPADPVGLVFDVYESYCQAVEKPENIDDFWHWGEMMLSDFDDIDKYLVDASSIYQNIYDLKEIDSHFDLTEEQKETVRKFWGFFMSNELSAHKESFLKIWNILHTVYKSLNTKLRTKGIGYEGMIYREVAESIAKGIFPDIPYEKVIICGFNALTQSERGLFRYLKKSGKARFFWDYDLYYLNDGIKEAGRFMRLNLEEFPPDVKLETFDSIHSRQVDIYELPSDITQAKYLNTILQKENSQDLSNFNHTAVILGDEELLIPVLTSMPENVEEINITMGYPMSSTPVYSFVNQLLRMQKNIGAHKGKRKDKFYFRDVLSVLNHQYLKLGYEEKVLEMINKIHKNNLIYINSSFFGDIAILKMIFRKAENVKEVANYILDVLLEIATMIGLEEQSLQSKLEKEYIFHLLTRVNILKGIFDEHDSIVSIDTFTRVIRKILKNLKIPFEGEPLAGLQIMGILESRLLDFSHVIFLSMNDGVMPRSNPSFSYIPHNLRYAYGMPTREDQDAIYAYYFYRLLQRSSKVSMLYNSKADGMTSGEKSRYIYQILYDPRFKPVFRSIGFNISSREALPISIPKTPEIFRILSKYAPESQKFLSPSALNTYLNCRLRFYFSYVAGLKEVDSVSEEIESDTFGNLLHEAMQDSYRDFEGKTINPENFKQLLDPETITTILNNSFRKVYYKSNDPELEINMEGRNIIVYEVLKRFMVRMLEIDRKHAPFEIVSLEKTYSIPIQSHEGIPSFQILLGGKIDRVDKKDGTVRIIDYKTGNAETKFSSIEKLFDRNDEKRNKAAFQTILYSWLYSQASGELNVNPGLYITRKIFQPDFSPHFQMDKDTFIYVNAKEEFEHNLYLILEDIMDSTIPFDQTLITKNCEYCPYSGLCHRNTAGKS